MLKKKSKTSGRRRPYRKSDAFIEKLKPKYEDEFGEVALKSEKKHPDNDFYE